jgi:tetratricopeptide (TPR) repeat protein
MDALKRTTLEGDEEARASFRQALELDPHYAPAHAGLSVSHFNEWSCQAWHLWDESSEGAFDHASRAARLDSSDAMVQAVLARVCRYRHQHAEADAHAARALALNPNDSYVLVQVGIVALFGGRPDEGLGLVERAMQCNPLHPPWYEGTAGWCLYIAGRSEEALPLLERGGDTIVNFGAYRAACHALAGRLDRARSALEHFERQYREKIAFGREPGPGEALRWAIQVEPFRRFEDSALMPDSLREAGLADVDVADALATRAERLVRPADIARPQGCTFRGEDGVWTVDYEGTGARLTEVKGFHDLARLLAAPDAPVHCMELVGAPPETHTRHEVLDDEARRSYRNRIEELQQDLEHADAEHDLARAERLRAELDALVDELVRASGLGGRPRELGSRSERARSAVTWRIRSAIRKIRAAHPRLGQHLANSIRTGRFCVYAPETPVAWIL